jgi:hypothetical protein
MKVDNLFCFVLSRWDFPNQIASCYVIDIFENLTMSGCTDLGRKFLELWCKGEWILLLKIQTHYKELCLEGKMGWVCSSLGSTIHVTLFIHGGLDSLFCFVIMISPKPWCLCYAMELIIRNFSMGRVALTWFRMFGAMLWNLLNHFSLN